MENRHRTKVLSSNVQIQERRKLVNEKRIEEFNVKMKQYQSEQHEEDLNISCEAKFVKIILKMGITDPPVMSDNQSDVEFKLIREYLTLDILQSNMSEVKNTELKSFIKVRSPRSMRHGKVSFRNIPSTKEALVRKCIDVAMTDRTPQISLLPTYPSLLSIGEGI